MFYLKSEIIIFINFFWELFRSTNKMKIFISLIYCAHLVFAMEFLRKPFKIDSIKTNPETLVDIIAKPVLSHIEIEKALSLVQQSTRQELNQPTKG